MTFTVPEMIKHQDMLIRKAAAFDWFNSHGEIIYRHILNGGPQFVCRARSTPDDGRGPTPLEAVEAAMKGTE